MSTKKRIIKRLDELEEEIRKRYDEFWDSFNNDELEALSCNEPEAIRALLDDPEFSKLSRLYEAVMTPGEWAAMKQGVAELKRECGGNKKRLSR
jgi:HSP90 family molecular chaperone